MNLGEKLKFLRKYHDYNQKDVAENIGVGISAYSQYENNVRSPSYGILSKITQFYSINYDFLFDDSYMENDRNFQFFLMVLGGYKNSLKTIFLIDEKLKTHDPNDKEGYEYLLINLGQAQANYNQWLERAKALGYDIENVEDIFDKYF